MGSIAKPIVDCSIKIWISDLSYYARVIESPRGETDPERLRAVYQPEQMEITRLRLENAVLRNDKLRAGTAADKIFRTFGNEMYRMLLVDPPKIRENYLGAKAFADGQGSDLRLKLLVEAPDLATLPWEYMCEKAEGEAYICLHPRSPIVRLPSAIRRSLDQKNSGQLKILAMSANPGRGEPRRHGWASIQAEKEKELILAAISELQQPERVKFQSVQGETLSDLLDWIERDDWDVFHFIGHGGVEEVVEDGETIRQGFVVFGNGVGDAEKVRAQDLANVLTFCPSLKLVVLNCCESALGSGSSNPAATLVQGGIPSVLAMQYPLHDDVAISFSKDFYKQLANGKSLERALTATRVIMHHESVVHWGIPVLYTEAPVGRLCTPAEGPLTATGTLQESAYEESKARAQEQLVDLFMRAQGILTPKERVS